MTNDLTSKDIILITGTLLAGVGIGLLAPTTDKVFATIVLITGVILQIISRTIKDPNEVQQ